MSFFATLNSEIEAIAGLAIRQPKKNAVFDDFSDCWRVDSKEI
jgi:hypothetical protein